MGSVMFKFRPNVHKQQRSQPSTTTARATLRSFFLVFAATSPRVPLRYAADNCVDRVPRDYPDFNPCYCLYSSPTLMSTLNTLILAKACFVAACFGAVRKCWTEQRSTLYEGAWTTEQQRDMGMTLIQPAYNVCINTKRAYSWIGQGLCLTDHHHPKAPVTLQRLDAMPSRLIPSLHCTHSCPAMLS